MQTPHPEFTALKTFFLFPLLFIATLTGCTPKEASLSPLEQARKDSLALHVAVMPVSDCLPLYLAQACGIADSMGLDMKLHTFMAQMDVDTALLGGRVHVAYSDLIRALRLMDRCSLKAFMQGHTRMSLVTQKGKRIQKIHQMKERMVAISRLSVSDYWCDAMLDSAFMLPEDVYRPQVHDVRLRTEMLRTQLLEAALLPRPYDEWMKADGNFLIYSSPEEGPHFPAWVLRVDSGLDPGRMKQVDLLKRCYEEAAKQIHLPHHRKQVLRILEQVFQIPAEVANTLSIPEYPNTSAPNSDIIHLAAEFLKKRERMPQLVNPDSLIWKPDTTAE